MRYRIEIWQYHHISETHESNDIREIMNWYIEKWKHALDGGNCTFYVYEDGKRLSFDELYDLGFYKKYA